MVRPGSTAANGAVVGVGVDEVERIGAPMQQLVNIQETYGSNGNVQP